MRGTLYWVSYFVCRGHNLDYLLNLSEIEKIFYIESMDREIEEMVELERQKLETMSRMQGVRQ